MDTDDANDDAVRSTKRRKVEEEKKDASMEYTGKYPVGYKIRKKFEGYDDTFVGEVQSYDAECDFYLIHYNDGDEEEMNEEELSKLEPAKKTAKRKKNKTKSTSRKKKAAKEESTKEAKIEVPNDDDSPDAVQSFSPELEVGGRLRRARKRVSYAEEINDEDIMADSEEEAILMEAKPKAKRAKNKKTVGRLKRSDSDDESASIDSVSSSEDELDFESESEDDEPPSEDEKPKGKKKAAAAKGGPAKEGKKKMCDSFQPSNFPLYKELSLEEIQKDKEFLDPCGMEATDDIIDRLVGEQLDKIGSLLQRALANDDGLGSSGLPLKLGTACSGTDAPALALTLVQEQMELRGLGNLFNFTHEFSCENDPFKQAYLARNFDSILYPDIAKLTDEPPRDVYGQEKAIPPFNLFVAGTSCKNFSMLRSNRRIDIEDKGCSGETFMAATELLFKEKPSMAIFENVTGAPWGKMQEYITGRIKLSECDSKKAVKEIKDSKKELMFILDKDKNIVVDQVPAVYGVRCGAVVSGFLRPGSSSKLHDVRWPSGSQKSCKLSELLKANKISKQDDTLVFETDCTYCTHIVNVDTKMFGLPQTRQRTYMLVWRPDDDDVHDDLGEYWERLVRHLESPVRHSLQSFILQVDHDIIRVFREALRGPPGRQTVRSVFLEPDFWAATANANLPHNVNVRAALGLKDRARFITQWEGFGKRQIPPHYWLEYMKCNYQRETDMVDILHASAMRDAEAHDSNFASFYWNLSQNVSKEKHRSACAGIAGCITPGGDFLLPAEGRPILGCEKLMIQGIPYFRLALGNETEVQLGDLAGNAMSLTVICSTMLAAITCKQLRRETLDSSHGKVDKILSTTSSLQSRKKLSVWKDMVADRGSSLVTPQASNASSFFRELASVAPAAVKSSIWCTCETSGSNSLTTKYLQCKVCGVSCCRNCMGASAGYNLDSHETVEVEISADDHSLGNFQSKLRNLVPPTIIFNKEGIQEIAGINGDEHRVSGLSNYTFSLHRIKRDRRKWYIIYYARDNNGVGEAVAEFRITVGELRTTPLDDADSKNGDLGMRGELTSFFPARTEPLVYGRLGPCAVVTVKHGQEEVNWEAKCADTASSVLLEGSDAGESFRAEVGLTDDAASALVHASKQRHNIKHFKAAKDRGEERRWVYPKNWKQWPDVIHLKGTATSSSQTTFDLSDKIYGVYKRARCRQTTNQSALWIKEVTAEQPISFYILINPNVNRTGPDTAVVTSSISHDETSYICATLPSNWQPCDALVQESHQVDNVQMKRWISLNEMNCMVPSSNVTVASPAASSNILVSITGLSETDIGMLCRSSGFAEGNMKLGLSGGQKAQQTVRVFNSICVAPILKHAAGVGLKYDLTPGAPWISLKPSNGSVPFGCCTTTVPIRPSEEWFLDKERGTWERRSEPGASRKYYLELQNAPQPFEVWVNVPTRTLSVKCFPEVVAHHAAGQLIEGRGGHKLEDEVRVSFRLSDVSLQMDPVVAPFKVSSCDAEKATFIGLKAPHKLYERQQKVVTKMLAIESSKRNFEEVELSEHEMPGSAGLSMIAKATRDRKMCGGVIADAIGSGKTVVSIAMILNGLEKARASRKVPSQSGATLVVVPPALIDQWKSEIQKFTTSLRVVQVYDHKTLSSVKVKDIIEADVVICPIDILESKGYMERLVKVAKLDSTVKDLPKLPMYTGQQEQTAARGVWIPATSADPYGGANNSNNQKRRNQSAHYTHMYLTAVRKLREKEFKASDKGVPLEYFEWERVIVDEIHESLCTSRNEMNIAKDEDKKANNSSSLSSGFFKEKNRRAGRELLGITQKDIRRRPLIFRKAIFGLTGTPLLDSSSRVIELANLMGNTYVVGLSSHWRKLERESCRDIFLHNYLEPKQSREIRKHMYAKCQEYVQVACCRNKTGEEMNGIELVSHQRVVRMSQDEKLLYFKSQSGITSANQSFSIKPEDFDVSAGHDISKFLRQNAKLDCRGAELVRICKEILARKGDEHTKIIVFTDGRIGAGDAARKFLEEEPGLGCTWLDNDDSVETKNQKISWYQHGDATLEDKKRPRILLLHFEHAAGLNLQTECHDLILFTPLYVGEGGSSSDAVSDASTELQAIGRVYRPGQTNPTVNVYRIEVQGPDGEDCLDGQLCRRNTDEETVSMAVNSGE